MYKFRNFFFFLFFLFALGLFFPKQANAQSCSGSKTTTRTVYACAYDTNLGKYTCPSSQQTKTYNCSPDPVTSQCFACADNSNTGCTISPDGQSCVVNGGGQTCDSSVCSSGCNSDGNCLASGLICCSGNSHSDSTCASGIRCGPSGSTPPPAGTGCGACNTCGIPQWCAMENGSCVVDSCACAGVGCGGGGSDPCPNDSCAGTCCNYACVTQPCIVTADCAPSSSGQPVICAWGTNPTGSYCRNANCPNNTVPGSICGCSGGLVCGQACAGGCTGNSTCRYTTAPGGSCVGGASTYCIGDTGNNLNTYNPSYTTPKCLSGDTGNSYLLGPAGQSTGFTQAQINSTCKPGPWFQVKDGDVITNGRIQSLIPLACSLPACTPYFNLDGTGGFPGVVVYGSSLTPNFTVSGGGGTVSSKKWLANTTYNGKTYNYNYFEGLIPSTVQVNDIATDTISGNYFQVNGTPKNNFVWFRRNGNLTLTGNVNVNNTRKVILLVKGGNLTISSSINVQKIGDGFFMAITNGNINIDPTLTAPAGKPALEGLFLADGVIHTGGGTNQLYVRGTLAGLGGISLERDLGNNNGSQPAEFIEYAPDLIFSYPRDLAKSRVIWREVAP